MARENNKSVIISIDDVPTKLNLIHTISRLQKDYDILKRTRGTNDKEDPRSYLASINFLEMLVRREGRRLAKEEDVKDPYITHAIDTALEAARDHLSKLTEQELSDLILLKHESLHILLLAAMEKTLKGSV